MDWADHHLSSFHMTWKKSLPCCGVEEIVALRCSFDTATNLHGRDSSLWTEGAPGAGGRKKLGERAPKPAPPLAVLCQFLPRCLVTTGHVHPSSYVWTTITTWFFSLVAVLFIYQIRQVVFSQELHTALTKLDLFVPCLGGTTSKSLNVSKSDQVPLKSEMPEFWADLNFYRFHCLYICL